jgi:ubiquinone/menaquinone biosynthesis C-methylase UbiE
MTSVPDNLFTDDVAKVYDSVLVPLLFEPYARDVAERVRALDPCAVLEIACGTGAVTRTLANVLPASCVITATDLSLSMVAYAESRGAARAVHWRQADAMTLPFDDASFDVVVCQFGAMFFPDRVSGYRQVRRVLRRSGAFLFNVWTRIEESELALVVSEALDRRYPDDRIEFLARIPHGYGSARQIEADVLAAGFSRCEITELEQESIGKNAEHVASAFCMGTPTRLEIEKREPGGLANVTAAVTQTLEERYGEGPIRARMNAIVVKAS